MSSQVMELLENSTALSWENEQEKGQKASSYYYESSFDRSKIFVTGFPEKEERAKGEKYASIHNI